MTLQRTAWVRPHRPLLAQMGYGLLCGCGADDQTVNHIVLQLSTDRTPHGLHGLTVLGIQHYIFILTSVYDYAGCELPNFRVHLSLWFQIPLYNSMA